MGFTAAAATLSAVGTIGSVVEQQQQGELAKKQNKLQRRRAQAQNIRAKQEALRASEIQRSQIQNIATQTGASESSGVSGALGSAETQLQSEVSFQGQLEGFDIRRSGLEADRVESQRRGQLFGFAQQLGFAGLSKFGGKKE